MNTLLTFLLVIICVAMSGMLGFIAGRGNINIVAPLTREQRERNERMLKDLEAEMENYNMAVRNISGFGGDIDGI